ncbi:MULTISPECIES: 2-dehydro-3-deoxy-6-phosphogalactonate aldolase [unclassified Avibacterium]|uniref:2-dehydro-3-deoxy-6-phosphogalactonate aldolase n=1 Tax=unclassified Avibacterium TaxID=2685287 RepID=UPI0020260EED|nr:MULTISPECIES: 2-dehydro-3-deoxy-6-phosphogalactonate aldolase [unclassified Avibacterium]MCW9699798.1 2-dehydro-3-deoxy-6-phosphogalactonate aldolase [Avibacterium sp. 20-129]URL06416.1 2-dehydro-3-deoxy-6-phosphogalactonate aldolase [Avibacterium sp. 21-595]
MKKQEILNEKMPLVAILRGITTDQSVQYVSKLIELGYYYIEVPLNSPNALDTLRLLYNQFGQQCLIGAGTVTDEHLLQQVLDIGIKFIVTPNMNTNVIKLAKANNCTIFVGVMTPTEAYDAIHCGANLLKIYPAEVFGYNGFKAIKTVIPPEILCFPVGGINADSEQMKKFLAIGASGFGIGSALYSSGLDFNEFAKRAEAFKSCYENAKSQL